MTNETIKMFQTSSSICTKCIFFQAFKIFEVESVYFLQLTTNNANVIRKSNIYTPRINAAYTIFIFKILLPIFACVLTRGTSNWFLFLVCLSGEERQGICLIDREAGPNKIFQGFILARKA